MEMNVPTAEEVKALQKTISKLKVALRSVLRRVTRLHDRPFGATRRCPRHVNPAQKRLCRVAKTIKVALDEKGGA